MMAVTLDAADAAAIAAHFRAIATKELSPAVGATWTAAIRHTAEARRHHAARVVLALDDRPGPDYPLDDGDAREAIRELVDQGMVLRARAYASPDFDHSRAVGGCFTRMLVHDQSPEADALDRLALAIAAGIPGLDDDEQIRLCT